MTDTVLVLRKPTKQATKTYIHVLYGQEVEIERPGILPLENVWTYKIIFVQTDYQVISYPNGCKQI